MANGTPVSRATGSGRNTINRRRVRLFFQRFAGTNAASGIQGLEFTITVNGVSTAPQQTPADGKVEILLNVGDTAQLHILGSTYDVSLLVGALHPVTELRGVQQRLNMLGYNAGALQGDNTAPVTAGIENQSTIETELAITNFQSDTVPLFIDAICGPKTQQKLKDKVTSTGGE